jgi:hypothetical protein
MADPSERGDPLPQAQALPAPARYHPAADMVSTFFKEGGPPAASRLSCTRRSCPLHAEVPSPAQMRETCCAANNGLCRCPHAHVPAIVHGKRMTVMSSLRWMRTVQPCTRPRSVAAAWAQASLEPHRPTCEAQLTTASDDTRHVRVPSSGLKKAKNESKRTHVRSPPAPTHLLALRIGSAQTCPPRSARHKRHPEHCHLAKQRPAWGPQCSLILPRDGGSSPAFTFKPGRRKARTPQASSKCAARPRRPKSSLR